MTRFWVDDALVDAARRARLGARPRPHRRRRRVRDDPRARRRAVRPHPAPRTGWSGRSPGLGIAGPGAAGCARRSTPWSRRPASPTAFSRLRITVTSGVGPVRQRPRRRRPPPSWSPCAAANPWPRTTTLATVPWTRNERSAIGRAQDHVVRRERRSPSPRRKRRGASEAVLADTQGRLCECTGSNVFVVVDGVVHTPLARHRLPRGRHPRARARVGPATSSRPARDRTCPTTSSAAPTRCSSPRPPATCTPSIRIDDRELDAGPRLARARARCSRRGRAPTSTRDRHPAVRWRPCSAGRRSPSGSAAGASRLRSC